MVLDDLRQAPVRPLQFFRFLQQLRGVADGAQGIADLVGDAGGQAAEGDQLELLGLLGDLRDVIEEHQDVLLLATLQMDEAGLQRRAVGKGLDALRPQGGVGLPMLQALQQLGAVRIEHLPGELVLAQEVLGAIVGEQDVVLRVQDQDAGAHALEDLGIQCFQVGDVHGALFGQCFAELQAFAQALDEQGRGEAEGAEASGLDELAGYLRVAEAEVEGQVDQPDGRHRRHQQANAPAQEDVGDGHRDHHQVGDATGDAARREKQAGQQQHIHQREAEHLHHAPRTRHQCGDQGVEDQVEPARIAEQLRPGQIEQAVVQLAGDQQHQQQADQQPIEAVETEDAPPLGAQGAGGG
ncbi:hypothetical protein D9M69_342210 [compost metagenome]